METIKREKKKVVKSEPVEEVVITPSKGKKVKLDKESYLKLKVMFASPDKENHVVALGILEECDVKKSMPMVLMLYKLFNESTIDGWASPKLMELIKRAGMKLEGQLTINRLYEFIKGNYPKEDIQVVLDEVAVIFHTHLHNWGFKFLGNMDLILREKE